MNNTLDNNPSYFIPFSFWIKSVLSFRFISNISIICSILAYYTKAYELLFIFAPLMIVNFIMITYILFTNGDDLMKTLLEKYLPTKKSRDNYKIQFIIFIILSHSLPLLWLYYILQKDNLFKIFRPNFMGIYFKSVIIPILYYYYQGNIKLYGNINYLLYFIFYIILLLGSCIFLYME
jgi:hypothetical protein